MLRLEPSVPGDRLLVFLPGFMSSAASYRSLLEPLTADGISVVVPQLYKRGLGALTGRATVEQEARDAADLVREVARSQPRVVLAGHSRGGQAAWRAANLLAAEGLPAGLVLVDPVDGSGRSPSARTATAADAVFASPCVVVGAGIGGRCAPEPVNHAAFAAATPRARHLVVTRLGHGDVLDERPRASARRVCGGAEDPEPGRAVVTHVLAAVLLGDDSRLPEASDLVQWRRR